MDAQWVTDALGSWLAATVHVHTDAELESMEADSATRKLSSYNYGTVMTMWPVVRAVSLEVKPPRPLPPWSDVADGTFRRYRTLIAEIRSEVQAQALIDQYVRPSTPQFNIGALHSWVWESARPLWDVNRQDAINAAARAVNAQIQRKVRRPDLSEVALTNQVFSDGEATEDQVRLHFPGQHTPNWKSRMAGARGLGQACFQGVRNITSHQHELDLPEHVAVEYLTMFSTLCRWVEECYVSRGEPLVERVVINVTHATATQDVGRALGSTSEDESPS